MKTTPSLVGPLALGFLVAGFTCVTAQAASTKDETKPIRRLHQLEDMPRLRPAGVTNKMFSSYDRKGGNDDGFKGTYSKLRVENGNSVVAEMEGAGCIRRIHMPHSIYRKPGVLGRKGEHIRIYLDGKPEPALDVPLEALFRGEIDGFPKPLVGEGHGGHYCYVPIPYRNGCKVVFEGTDVRFYAVQYDTFPSAEGVVTFTNPPTAKQREALAAAAKMWKNVGQLSSLNLTNAETRTTHLKITAGSSVTTTLPDGPRMIRAISVDAGPEALRNANSVKLQIRWDGADKPAVDLPLDYFFCQAMEPPKFHSLLVGNTDEGWYNYMPMPYGKSATITLRADKPFQGTLNVVSTPLPEWKDGEFGYFHTAYNESMPTRKDVFHDWLKRKGRGHYIGSYLATRDIPENERKEKREKERKMPFWLEGDEWFTCDGEMRIHGTGTEDYFNCGWYAVPGRLNGPCALPTHGFPVYGKKNGLCRATAFRWHIADPIPYEKSIHAKIEHGPGNNTPTYYRSAAFYYDEQP
jgi:hypothetical protein